MKILWITPWFGNYRIAVYDHLCKISAENFYLICSQRDTSKLVQQKLNASLGDHALIMSGAGDICLGNHDSDFANTGLVIRRQKGLYKAIKAINADLIIVEGFGGWAPCGIWYGIFHRKKILIFYERTAYVERNSPWWRTLYRRIVGRFVAGFLINGTLTHQYLKQLGFGKYPMVEGCMVADSDELKKSVEQMNGAAKKQLKDQLNISPSGLVFLFVGQLVERKGIKQLLSAWETHIKEFPTDTLLVVGTGILYDTLYEQYKTEPTIKILGAVDYSLIHRYYAIASVFVMPTLEDNWSLVVPEAMACGLPVATTLYNGCYVELIKDGENGYVFDAYDRNNVIEVLAKFHSADLSSMGKRSLDIVKEYTPEIAAHKIYDLCVRVLQESKS